MYMADESEEASRAVTPSHPQGVVDKEAQAIRMWENLRAFADKAADDNITLTALFQGEQTKGDRTIKLNTHVTGFLDEDLCKALGIKEGTSLVHIWDTTKGRPQLRRDIYLYVGDDGTHKVMELVKEGETRVAKPTQLTLEYSNLVQTIGQATAVPYALQEQFGSYYEFSHQLDLALHNEGKKTGVRPTADWYGIGAVYNHGPHQGWTLYNGGLQMMMSALEQSKTGKYASSSELIAAGPLAGTQQIFKAIAESRAASTTVSAREEPTNVVDADPPGYTPPTQGRDTPPGNRGRGSTGNSGRWSR